MGRRGLVCFDYPADYDSQVLKASEYPRSDLFHLSEDEQEDDKGGQNQCPI
jgi:hypothetical protein